MSLLTDYVEQLTPLQIAAASLIDLARHQGLPVVQGRFKVIDGKDPPGRADDQHHGNALYQLKITVFEST